MRVAHIINHLGVSGVNQVVADLVSVFNAHGHECVIYYLKACDSPASYPCPVVPLDGSASLPEPFDVIHAHGVGPMLYVMKHRRALAKRNGNQGRPLFVTTLHCYCFQDLPSLYGWAKGGLMALAYLASTLWQDRVVCLSQDMMRYYSRWISRRKLRYVYNTRLLPSKQNEVFNPDDATLVDQLKSWHAQGHTVIGMNGVLIYRKGVDLMLRALRLLNLEGCRFRLVLVGDGQDRGDFEKLCQSLGLNDEVLYAGHRKDAYRFLPYYDILALPSHSEGFPLSLLEAAVYQKKVVVSELPIVKECFGYRNQGASTGKVEVAAFKIDPDQDATVLRLAEAIRNAMANDAIGARLRQRFDKDYSPEVFYQRYDRVYNENKSAYGNIMNKESHSFKC